MSINMSSHTALVEVGVLVLFVIKDVLIIYVAKYERIWRVFC